MSQTLLSFWLFEIMQHNLCMTVSLDYCKKMHWTPLNHVALAIDVSSSMSGQHTGLAARMRSNVPPFINVHCIVHYGAPDVGDATRICTEVLDVGSFCQ